jgi:hypothetical protein
MNPAHDFYLISLRSISISSSHQRPGLLSSSISSYFPTKFSFYILHYILLLHTCHKPCFSHPSRFEDTNILWEKKSLFYSIIYFVCCVSTNYNHFKWGKYNYSKSWGRGITLVQIKIVEHEITLRVERRVVNVDVYHVFRNTVLIYVVFDMKLTDAVITNTQWYYNRIISLLSNINLKHMTIIQQLLRVY